MNKKVMERLRTAMLASEKGGPLTTGQVEVVRRVLVAESLRSRPARGQGAAVAEASATLGKLINSKGRVRQPPKAKGTAKRTPKAKGTAKRTAEAAIVRRAVTEVLTPRAGIRESARAAAGPADPPSIYGALAAQGQQESPIWRTPPAAAAPGRPRVTAAELAAMDLDPVAFRAYADAEHQADVEARGFRSPIWRS